MLAVRVLPRVSGAHAVTMRPMYFAQPTCPPRLTASALLLASLAFAAHAQPAPKVANAVPDAWKDVDKTLTYEAAVNGALRRGDLAPLRTAQQEIAAEGTPTNARLMARLNAMVKDRELVFKMGPCHYAAVLVRGMVLNAYEASDSGRSKLDDAPSDEQAAQYAEHIARCERLARRQPSPRLIGGE